MNFLAHIYLSFDHPEISIGNFMADSIKREALSGFSPMLQKGVYLHRAIDQFTDTHSIYKKSCKRLFKTHGHYSRVIVDIFYDHFLAAQWKTYHPMALSQFATNFYSLLESNMSQLPAKTQYLFPYLKAQNWLVAYETIAGLDGILKGMHRRASFSSKMDVAILDLQAQYPAFKKDFNDFFKELIIFSKDTYQYLLNQ